MRSGYTVVNKKSRVVSSENDYLWVPNMNRKKYGVVFLHGAGTPKEYHNDTSQFSSAIPAMVASAGIPCVAAEMHGNSFANDNSMADIAAAITLLGTTGCDTTKVHIFGVSMGGAVGLRYTGTNPTKVATYAGMIPLTNLQAAYDSTLLRPDVQTAWGLTYPAPLPARANLDTHAATVKSNNIPARLYYTETDTTIPPSMTKTSAPLMGAELIDIGSPYDHTEYTIAYGGFAKGGTNWSEYISWLKANGS